VREYIPSFRTENLGEYTLYWSVAYIVGSLVAAIFTIDTQYNALMDFVVILVAGGIILVGMGKLN
jgi:hypothetical protein